MVLSPRDASVLRRFEDFCALEGLGPAPRALGDAAVIEAFLELGCRGLAAHSLGTYRATLGRLSGARAAGSFPASLAPAPYGSAEVVALWSMAHHQRSARRVDDAIVAVATLLGAGLRPGELAVLDATDVRRRRGQVSVTVRGPYPRDVAVLEPFAVELVESATRRNGYLFRPGVSVRTTKNLVNDRCARLVRDGDEVRLTSGRARATFICSHLRSGTTLDELCALAGLRELESLLRYARHVEGAPRSKAALRACAQRERR
ncbi:MAG TPA: hypothetical protein VMV53_05160 [Acidimicrobiales bacterium]|nr:hypothetical protein [Acidimicrobiales bacterium]